MKKWLAGLLVVLISVVLAFTASCGPGEGEANTYKLGYLGPLTGPAASWGIPIKNGMEMAAEEINDAGGIVVAGETYMLQIVAADDRFVPEGAVTAVQKLIYDDKIQYIWGPIGSACALAVQPITEENRVAIFAISSDALGPEHPYTFSYLSSPTARAEVGYPWLKQNRPEVQRVALMAEHTPTGEAALEGARVGAEGQGLEVVAAEYFEPGITDFAPLLTRMLAKNPDVIDPSSTPAGPFSLIVKQAREMGYEGLFYTSYQPAEEVLVVGAGAENAEGIIAAGGPVYPKGTPEQQAFYQKYIEKYGKEVWQEAVSLGYRWVYWTTLIFEQVDSFDPDLVVEALAESEFEGIVATYRFGGEETYGIAREVEGNQTYLNIFHNGEWEPLAIIPLEW